MWPYGMWGEKHRLIQRNLGEIPSLMSTELSCFLICQVWSTDTLDLGLYILMMAQLGIKLPTFCALGGHSAIVIVCSFVCQWLYMRVKRKTYWIVTNNFIEILRLEEFRVLSHFNDHTTSSRIISYWPLVNQSLCKALLNVRLPVPSPKR